MGVAAAAAFLLVRRSSPAPVAVESTEPGDLRAVWTDPVLRRVAVLAFLGFGVFIGLVTWLQALLEPRGVSESEAGAIITVAVAVGAVGSMVVAAVLEDRGGRGAAAPAALVAAVAGCCCSPSPPVSRSRPSVPCWRCWHCSPRCRGCCPCASGAPTARWPARRRCSGWPATSAGCWWPSWWVAWWTTRPWRSCCWPRWRSARSRWSAAGRSAWVLTGSCSSVPGPLRDGQAVGDVVGGLRVARHGRGCRPGEVVVQHLAQPARLRSGRRRRGPGRSSRSLVGPCRRARRCRCGCARPTSRPRTRRSTPGVRRAPRPSTPPAARCAAGGTRA